MHDVRRIEEDDLQDVVELILRVFDSDVASTFSVEGVEKFLESTPRESQSGLDRGHIFLAVGIKGDLAGVLRMTNEGYLYSLFVNPSAQRRGVGRALFEAGVAELKLRNPEIKRITLKSSMNAVKVYERWGFVQTGPMVEDHGGKIIPMELRIEEFT